MPPTIIDTYIAFTKRWEGGLSRKTADSASAFPCPTPYKGQTGWHTNVGVTYKVWKSLFGSDADDRFFAMSADDWFNVFKTLYWNSVRGDEFTSKNIAIIVTGVAWGSGKSRAVKTLQTGIRNCGVATDVDGKLGNETMKAANACNPRQLFDAITTERERFFRAIAPPGSDNAVFLKGWLNRLADYKATFRP
ncbi:MAG TPA: putative peptidoglycan-binding domain-containing protein [Flavobacteriales bacterium]|nr:putative peptidoglycan-binding domain-containing protein [Flavobacteriales bacterium]